MTKNERIKKRKELFKLLADGLDQKEASIKLGISENTITAWVRHQNQELDPNSKSYQKHYKQYKR